ncbi:unnamed protein product [Brassicogethes aeneus]|nr:unnamed protein product [Brassicogethes aeneus]
MIQDKFTQISQQIEERKKFINNRLEVISKLDLIINILKYKIYEVRYECRKNLDMLHIRKQKLRNACFKDLTEMQVAMELEEIDNQMKEEQRNVEIQLESLKEQKIEIQLEYESIINTMDIDMEQILELYNNLLGTVEEEKMEADPIDIEVIEEKSRPTIDEFKKDIDYFNEIKLSGWRISNSEEKLSDVLESKGLKITKDGLLITESGRLITIQEAKEEDYLQGIELDMEKSPLNEQSDVVSSKTSKTKTTTSEASSVYSRMDSEDVSYLKENLGKPLTLALAEITAVQPRDPIHYLGHWLFKFRYNQELDETQQIEIDALTAERDRLAKERWHKFLEEEARAAVMEMIMRAEEQAMKNELQRIADEMAALEDEEHEENFEDEARDVLGEYTGPKTISKINP